MGRREGEDKIDLTSDSLGGRIVKTKQNPLRAVHWWSWEGEVVVTEDSLQQKKGGNSLRTGPQEGERAPLAVPPPSARPGVRCEDRKSTSGCHLAGSFPGDPRERRTPRPPRSPPTAPAALPRQLRLIPTNLKLSSHSLAPSPRAAAGGRRGWGVGGRGKSPGKALKCHF